MDKIGQQRVSVEPPALPAYNNETKYGKKEGRSGRIGHKLYESV